jgi:hypothetical protein
MMVQPTRDPNPLPYMADRIHIETSYQQDSVRMDELQRSEFKKVLTDNIWHDKGFQGIQINIDWTGVATKIRVFMELAHQGLADKVKKAAQDALAETWSNFFQFNKITASRIRRLGWKKTNAEMNTFSNFISKGKIKSNRSIDERIDEYYRSVKG